MCGYEYLNRMTDSRPDQCVGFFYAWNTGGDRTPEKTMDGTQSADPYDAPAD